MVQETAYLRELQQGFADTVVRGGSNPREFSVIFTNPQATLAAVRAISGLARQLSAHISIVDARVVPYPLALEHPAADVGFLRRSALMLALRASEDVDVQIHFCRDRAVTLNAVLKEDAIVVLAGRKRWWQTAEQRLARMLQHGRRTVFLVYPTLL
ncbi:MAG: hypothetical protein ABI811_04725 [Acidobacteriota bacterium]